METKNMLIRLLRVVYWIIFIISGFYFIFFAQNIFCIFTNNYDCYIMDDKWLVKVLTFSALVFYIYIGSRAFWFIFDGRPFLPKIIRNRTNTNYE